MTPPALAALAARAGTWLGECGSQTRQRNKHDVVDIGDEDDAAVAVVRDRGGANDVFVRIVPVLGVPVQSKALSGQDSLLSIVQMPAGIPVGTLAIGEAGATNAGLLAAAILATGDPALAERLKAYRARQTASVAERPC